MITVDHVTFGYEEKKESLKDVSLEIHPGECVLLCGESGCGKTTITKLINGLIPHFTASGMLMGNVDVEGMCVKDVEVYQLSEKVGSVFQNPKSQFFYLDTDSELEFGLENRGTAPDVIRERIKATVKDLKIEHLLHRNVYSLSGGEKQRISIARAMLKDAPVIILDEATASIDPENEHLIQNAISELTKGKTIITIAHRLATIEQADQILVVDDGRIVQKGTHAELTAQEGKYKDFVQLRRKAENWNLAQRTVFYTYSGTMASVVNGRHATNSKR